MTLSPSHYGPNTSRIAAKVMDGEAVIIDLVSGTYFSLAGTGGRVWSLLEAGSPLSAIAQILAREYDVTADRALGDVQALCARLLNEQLVVALDAPTAPQAAAAGTGEAEQPDRAAYRAPELQIYRDMQDLLALDPPMPGLQDISWQ